MTVREGAELSWRHYNSDIFRKMASGQILDTDTSVGFLAWGAYGSADYKSPAGKVNFSIGLRTDGASYSRETVKIWKQLSPRAAVSYMPWKSWSFNASAGLYNQLPPMTALSFRDQNGVLTNTALEYMRVASAAAGADWRYRDRLFVSLEGFYKHFFDIPVSVATGVPLTCIGADYGSIGEEPLKSSGAGRAYGAELMVRWIIPDKVTLVGSATLYKSEYRADDQSDYVVSAWDNNFIINLSAVYDLPHYWSIGAKISAIGGAPYTPYDMDVSALKSVWDASGKPVYDYSRYNMARIGPYYQIDLRIDKDFYFRKWTLGLYVDLQNVTFSRIKQPDTYLNTGMIINPDSPLSEQRYELEPLELYSGTIVPSIGITVEF